MYSITSATFIQDCHNLPSEAGVFSHHSKHEKTEMRNYARAKKKRIVWVFTVSIITIGIFTSQIELAQAVEPVATMETAQSAQITDILASGYVKDGNGKPLDDTTVIALAWPDPFSLSDSTVGDSFTPEVLASTFTDSRGHYTLRVDSIRQERRAGTMQVQFVALGSQSSSTWFSTVDLATATPRYSPENSTPTTAANNDNARLGAESSLDFTVSGSSVSSVVSAPSGCVLQSNLGAQDVIVGQTYSTVSGGHTRKFTYTASASTSVGVGVSKSGAFGSFSSSRTVTASSTTTIGFPTYSDAVGRVMKTQFTFGLYRCSYPVTYSVIDYVVYPIAFAGGATVATVSNPTATYCNTYIAGATFSKDSSTAITWSNGVSIAAKIGIDLSAKTDYSTKSKIDFTFSSTRQLCGQGNYPGLTNAYTVVVK